MMNLSEIVLAKSHSFQNYCAQKSRSLALLFLSLAFSVGAPISVQAQMSPDVIDPGIVVVGDRVQCRDIQLLNSLDHYLRVREESLTTGTTPEEIQKLWGKMNFRARLLGCSILELKEDSTLRAFHSLKIKLPESERSILLCNQGTSR